MLMELLPGAPRRVLDLGTGDGYTLGLVRERAPGASTVSASTSRPRCSGSPGSGSPVTTGVEIVEHDLDDPLPAPLGRFDLVVSSFAIHHCVDERKRALYGEVFELLEPGGRVPQPRARRLGDARAARRRSSGAIGKTPARGRPVEQAASPSRPSCAGCARSASTQVDCHWKWREIALLAGVKPA